MSRTRALSVVVASLLLLSAAVAPVAAGPFDDATGQVTQVTYGSEGIPSWHVHVKAGELSTLETWANSSDSLAVLERHNASNYALLKAPKTAAGLTTFAQILGNGLASKSYVTAIRPNYQHSLAEPVTLQNASAVPAPSWTTRSLSGIGQRGGEWSRDGIAYLQNTNATTLDETHGPLGVDNVSATGQGALVAVIDSGLNTANGQTFGNGTAGSTLRVSNASKDFISNETVGADGIDAVADPNGHGTFVAAQVAANTSNASYDGVAPNANILALRTLDESGQGSTGDIARAIRYAADHNADAIVMSLGSPVYDAELTSALEYAVDHNVSAIAIAAGNSRETTRWLATPADAPVDGVTAVSASNTSGNATAGIAYFANTGNGPGLTDASAGKTAGQDVDVAAPGMRVQARVPTTSGSTQLVVHSGTSMAAPQVIGIAALGVETNEPWVGNASAFKYRLRVTAEPMPNAAVVEAGQGMANAQRLLANETGGDQESAMDTAAQRRNAFWTGLGDWERWSTFSFLS